MASGALDYTDSYGEAGYIFARRNMLSGFAWTCVDCRKSAAKSFIEAHSKSSVMPLAKVEKVYDKCWIAEPVLWTRWKHRGVLAYLVPLATKKGTKKKGPKTQDSDIRKNDRIERAELFSKTFESHQRTHPAVSSFSSCSSRHC